MSTGVKADRTTIRSTGAVVATIVVLAAIPLVGLSDYLLGLLILVFMYVALASSWNIVGGLAGYQSFGHVAYFGIGAYTTALLLHNLGWSPFLTAPLAGLVAGIFAALVGYPCLRLRGPYFALVTLTVALAVNTIVLNVPWTKADVGLFLPFLPLEVNLAKSVFYEAMLALAALAVLVLRAVQGAKLGTGLVAIREDEEVAQTLCINTTLLKMQAFVLSAFLTGLVGGIYSYYRTYVHPTIVFDTNISVAIVLMALFGGSRSWVGPILGAAILTLASEFLTLTIGAETAHIIFGLLLIVVILFMPDGLAAYLKPRRRQAPLPKQVPSDRVAV